MNLAACQATKVGYLDCGRGREAIEAHRVMRLVLPTLWSPSSTIFVRFSVPDDTSVVGDVGLAILNAGGTEGRGGFQAK